MEHQLWKEILRVLRSINKPPKNAKEQYSDEEIVRVWLWAVLHDRPVSWACQRQSWPLHDRRRQLPSSSRVSRRLRTPGVRWLLQEIEAQVLRPERVGQLLWMMDGKPLLIGGSSKDRQSGAARRVGRGYKLHALLDAQGNVAAWRVAPLNKDEKTMARRMIRVAALQGYLLADGNYDSNRLHEACEGHGNLQLITPHRASRTGVRRPISRQSPGRLRSLALQEAPHPEFARSLLRRREDIERYFGRLSSWGGGLTHLPAWVRTHRRVHRWVQGKLILTGLRRRILSRTYDD
jgi:IS5 family transposase